MRSCGGSGWARQTCGSDAYWHVDEMISFTRFQTIFSDGPELECLLLWHVRKIPWHLCHGHSCTTATERQARGEDERPRGQLNLHANRPATVLRICTGRCFPLWVSTIGFGKNGNDLIKGSSNSFGGVGGMLRLLGLQSLPPSCFDAAVAVLLLCLFLKVLSACEIPIVITVALLRHLEH